VSVDQASERRARVASVMSEMQTTILIVDDEPHILRVLAFKLEQDGFCVVRAHSGESAWEKLHEMPISLMVTDYQMPECTGLELARRMADDAQLASIPVILLTGHCFSLRRAELAETSIVETIGKPFSPKEVVQRIAAVIQAKRGTMPHEAVC